MTLDICQRNVEFRAADSAEGSDGRNLDGYAAVFGAPTVIDSWEGRFTETIAKGAFRKTLRERKNVLMQWNHGGDSRVGHTPIGHYTELVEDDHGLRVKGRLFDNDLVEPIRQAIEAGAITGMSFKFRVVRDDWTDNMGSASSPTSCTSCSTMQANADRFSGTSRRSSSSRRAPSPHRPTTRPRSAYAVCRRKTARSWSTSTGSPSRPRSARSRSGSPPRSAGPRTTPTGSRPGRRSRADGPRVAPVGRRR